MVRSVKDAVYGLVVGDALGVPVEFKERGSFQITEMTGYGTYRQPPGTWSDDTSMTLATCDSIKCTGKIDTVDMRFRFEKWIFEGDYCADEKLFDYGMTTFQALSSGQGINAFDANGNGSLMRIIPLAFIHATSDEIAAVSAITHAHELSIQACQLYVMIARQLLLGEDLASILQNLPTYDNFPRLKILAKLKENHISSSGFVVHTLEASLWCLLTTTTFREAVLKAVNLGNDSDTTAAVTGALAGIIYGYEAIPKEWIAAIRNKELIDSCLF